MRWWICHDEVVVAGWRNREIFSRCYGQHLLSFMRSKGFPVVTLESDTLKIQFMTFAHKRPWGWEDIDDVNLMNDKMARCKDVTVVIALDWGEFLTMTDDDKSRTLISPFWLSYGGRMTLYNQQALCVLHAFFEHYHLRKRVYVHFQEAPICWLWMQGIWSKMVLLKSIGSFLPAPQARSDTAQKRIGGREV